ncbi:ATP-binding protein [Streptomyces hirsutus]|uniref:ATP-binding protein n=1 Tax=Streptomyces hirsutus TaxID=35620 RepID=UPI0033A79FE3
MTDADLLSRTFQIAERRPGQPPVRIDMLRVAEMRRLTRNLLIEEGLSCFADDVVLVVSELVTNAIQHSHGQKVTLTLSLCNGCLRINVHDGVRSHRPTPGRPCNEDEHGRGLLLVQAIAGARRGSWGVSDDGASTWCEFALAMS